MKTHPYLHRRLADRSLALEDVEEALAHEVRSIQPDGRVRIWGYVERMGYYIRVILLEDRETVFNAFKDGNFTRKRP